MKEFTIQPSNTKIGYYEVVKFSVEHNRYIPLKGEIYPTESQARDRVEELNRYLEEDNQQLYQNTQL